MIGELCFSFLICIWFSVTLVCFSFVVWLFVCRCLRWVCDSWQTFTEFSVFGEVKNQSSSKRRKASSESSNFKIEPSSGPAKIIPLYLEKKFKGDLEYRYEEQAYEQAKDCLLSLKKSVENLHLKDLFPYNPEVLLKRCSIFLLWLFCFAQYSKALHIFINACNLGVGYENT